MMASLKILISGAGIAGNALAYWLSKLGHNVTVIERFSKLRTTGLQLDLRGHGIEVMKRMGLEEAIRSKLCPEQGLQIVDRFGRRWARFPANRSGRGVQSFTTEYEIMRGDLCMLLLEACQNRVKFRFGVAILGLEEKDNLVEVRFKNGETERYDLVVGADGQGSCTRKLILGPDTEDCFHAIEGLFTGYFTFPRPACEDEEYMATMYIATGIRSIMTRRHNQHDLQVYIGGRGHESLGASYGKGVEEQKQALTQILQGAGWLTEEILKGMNATDNFYLERMGVVKLDSWSRGRVVLVGDAAYAPSAMTGMGTTSAIVGAYVLAGEIGRHCGRNDARTAKNGVSEQGALTAALKAYEDNFRPFMDQVQDGVLESKGNSLPKTWLGIMAFYSIARIASLLRLNIAEMFLKEKVKDWDLPDYKELL